MFIKRGLFGIYYQTNTLIFGLNGSSWFVQKDIILKKTKSLSVFLHLIPDDSEGIRTIRGEYSPSTRNEHWTWTMVTENFQVTYYINSLCHLFHVKFAKLYV